MKNIFKKAHSLYLSEKDAKAIKLIETVEYKSIPDVFLLYIDIHLNPSKGKVNKANLKKCIELYKEALSLGISETAYELGEIYLCDERFKENIDKAIGYYKKGSELGNSLCVFELLSYYRDNKCNNFEFQITLATKLLEDKIFKIAALNHLGRINLNSNFTLFNIKKGLEYYNSSCDLGNSNSCMKLMDFYYKGQFVEKNSNASFKYCLKAENGDSSLIIDEIIFWKNKLISELEN